MKGKKGAGQKKAAEQPEVVIPEVEVPNRNDISRQIESMQTEASELFKGQESWMHGDNLEVLKLRVGSTIINELNNLDALVTKTRAKDQGQPSASTFEKKEPEALIGINSEQTSLDKLINDLMRLSEKEIEMKNILGLASLSHYQGAYETHKAENLSKTEESTLMKRDSTQLSIFKHDPNGIGNALQLFNPHQQRKMGAILIDKIKKIPKPAWHAPWKLKRVHEFNLGYCRSSRLGALFGFRCDQRVVCNRQY